jgi:hypothetical protein
MPFSIDDNPGMPSGEGFRYGIAGFDASDTTDLSAAKMLLMRPDDPKIYELSMYWLPEDALNYGDGYRRERDDVPYRQWVERGLMRTVPGNTVPKRVFIDWLEEIKQNYGGTLTWQAICTGAHTFGQPTLTEATCETGSFMTSTCTVCGYTTVSAHSFDHDCDTGCNGCAYTREITHRTGDRFYDENAHWYECSVCGEVLEYELHQYYNTCDADCNVCGAVREIEHTPCETWGHDDSQHWLDCSVCGMTLESHEHIYDGRFDQICDTCGYRRILRGDMDDDGDVDYDDAVYLLLYTYFPERYPLNQAGDMDGNGVIDSDDAIRVLQYAESPDLYPLA